MNSIAPALNGPYKPYISMGEDTEITVGKNRGSYDNPLVEVHIETACEGGFKTLRVDVPTMDVVYNDGFSDDEQAAWLSFIGKRRIPILDISDGGSIYA